MVSTVPCLVATVVPSISGSRSRCTPSRLTSAPKRSERAQILSISSRNTMPFCSTLSIASRTTASSSSSLSASSSTRISCDSATVILRGVVRPPNALPKMSPRLTIPIWAPGMPGISKVGSDEDPLSVMSTSISLSSNLPWRSSARNFCRVSALALSPTSASSTRSSAAISAFASTSFRWRVRTMWMEISTRSRTICSTSRPT